MKKLALFGFFIMFLGAGLFGPNLTRADAPTSGTETGFVPLAPIPGLTDVSSNITSSTLTGFLNHLYLYLIGAAATLAVIMIIWGGLEISTQDSVSKHGDGVQKIQQAILGLVLVLSPVLVFSIINPSILNLSLVLPPLDTKSGTSTGSQSNGSNQGPVACADATYTGSGGAAASPIGAVAYQIFSKGSTAPADDSNFYWKEVNLAGCSCSDTTGLLCYAKYAKDISTAEITKCPEGDYAQCGPLVQSCINDKNGAASYVCVNTLDGKTVEGTPNRQTYLCTPTSVVAIQCSPKQ